MRPGECNSIHNHENFPNEAGLMRSSRLCVAIMLNPRTATQRSGSQTISAIAAMHKPSPQITPACAQGTKPQAKSTIVNSRRTSHRPRVRKKRETCGMDLPRRVERNVPVPEEREYGGTIVRNDAGEKQRSGRVCKVHRSRPRIGQEIACVIRRHNDHRQSAKHIYRHEAGSWRGNGKVPRREGRDRRRIFGRYHASSMLLLLDVSVIVLIVNAEALPYIVTMSINCLKFVLCQQRMSKRARNMNWLTAPNQSTERRTQPCGLMKES